MAAKIDVLLVDDHAVVRAGYKAYLSLSDNIRMIYEAERGEIACQLYNQYQPDIVIMDLSMPGMGGRTGREPVAINSLSKCKTWSLSS